MSSSGYKDSSYFERVQSQLRLNALSQVEGVWGNTAKLLNLAHMGATMVIGMLGATVKIVTSFPQGEFMLP